MLRPMPLLATLLTALALALYIAALATSRWVVTSSANVQVYSGIYEACWRQHDVGIEECSYINNDCTADFSDPVGTLFVTDRCMSLRVVRAFTVIATILTGFALLCLYLSSWTRVPFIPLRRPATLLSLVAGAFGLMAWAIFIAIARDTFRDWEYGSSFGLMTSAWVLNWVSALFAMIPWPYSPFEYDAVPLRGPRGETLTAEEAERQRAGAAERQRETGARGVGRSDEPLMAKLNRWMGLRESKPTAGAAAGAEEGYAEKWRQPAGTTATATGSQPASTTSQPLGGTGVGMEGYTGGHTGSYSSQATEHLPSASTGIGGISREHGGAHSGYVSHSGV